MKNFKEMGILIAFTILLASCHKTTTRPDTLPPNVSASEYFPNKRGDKWIYNVYDSAISKMEEVSVEITGTATLPKGEIANIWVYKYPDKIDTNFVFQSGDTIRFVPASDLNPNDYVVKETYVIPLSVGNYWTNLFLYDSVHVIKETQLSVNNLKFDNTYFLIEKGRTFNYLIYAEEYFKPTIGMVQLSKYENNFFIPENKVWYLKGYYLK
ncbi:MAG: hypothetical protein KGM16_15765 [Bacteroidota bacterium]|nr:hypothetical protein [Bacteroidota bacterium]